jgi:hypothetical protein
MTTRRALTALMCVALAIGAISLFMGIYTLWMGPTDCRVLTTGMERVRSGSGNTAVGSAAMAGVKTGSEGVFFEFPKDAAKQSGGTGDE